VLLSSSHAQTNQSEQLIHFDTLIGINNLGLMTGREYQYPAYSRNSHPYFSQKDWIKGTLWLDGFIFQSVDLKYDLVSQEVLVRKKSNGLEFSISLKDNSKLSSFELDGVQFKIIEQSTNNSFIAVEHFSGSRYALYRRYEKKGIIDSYTKVFQYVQSNELSLEINEELYPYNGKRTIKQHMSAHKKDIKNFIKANKLNLNGENVSDLSKLLEYAESL